MGEPSETERTVERKPWEEPFLEVLGSTGLVYRACEAVKVAGFPISRVAVYKHRRESEDFRERWDAVLAPVIDDLERNAKSRGAYGWDEEVYQNGELVGTKKRYSDTLTIAMLKAHRRETYGDDAGKSAQTTEREHAERVRKALQEIDETFLDEDEKESGNDA